MNNKVESENKIKSGENELISNFFVNYRFALEVI